MVLVSAKNETEFQLLALLSNEAYLCYKPDKVCVDQAHTLLAFLSR
jgi:hypothetical protein